MLRSNFELALALAIKKQEESGNGNTSLTKGFREVLKAMEFGDDVQVIDGVAPFFHPHETEPRPRP